MSSHMHMFEVPTLSRSAMAAAVQDPPSIRHAPSVRVDDSPALTLSLKSSECTASSWKVRLTSSTGHSTVGEAWYIMSTSLLLLHRANCHSSVAEDAYCTAVDWPGISPIRSQPFQLPEHVFMVVALLREDGSCVSIAVYAVQTFNGNQVPLGLIEGISVKESAQGRYFCRNRAIQFLPYALHVFTGPPSSSSTDLAPQLFGTLTELHH